MQVNSAVPAGLPRLEEDVGGHRPQLRLHGRSTRRRTFIGQVIRYGFGAMY